MKILITTEVYKPVINGVVTSIENLKDNLEKLGHQVKILTLKNAELDQEDPDVYLIRSFDVERIYSGARFGLVMDRKTLRAIDAFNPDIIHSQTEFSTFRMARKLAKKYKVPHLHTYHTLYEDYTHYFVPSKRVGKVIAKEFTRMILLQTDAVVVPSTKIKRLLLSYGVRKEIHVVPTGIDLGRFGCSAETEKQELRERLQLDPKGLTMLALGRVAKEKNLSELLFYLQKLNDPRIKLLIAGDGPYKKEIEEQVKQYSLSNQVIMLGMLRPERVPTYYEIADLFVNASQSETQGLTTIEAMASGTPLFCRKDECLKDVLIPGENGFTFDSYENFREVIMFFLNDKSSLKTLSQNASRIANEHFSSRSFAYKIESIYFKHLSERSLP